jgi:hypothetical protein
MQIDGQTYQGNGEVRLILLPKAGIDIYSEFQDIPDGVRLPLIFNHKTIEALTFGGRNIDGFLLDRDCDPSREKFAIRWCPRSQPIAGRGDDSTTIQRLVFHLFNFQDMDATRYSIVKRESDTRGIGHIDLAAGDWTIELQTLMGTPECFLRLRTEGGYGLTHVGSLQKSDGAAFSGQEAQHMLDLLRFFFSFVKGSWCYPVCPVGFDAAGERVWGLWSHPHEAWSFLYASWFDPHHPEQMVALFPAFMAKWENEDWRAALSEVLYWYLNSNQASRGTDAGIILTQSAIERFSYEYAVKDRRLVEAGGFKALKASDKFRLLFSSLDIPIDIPSSLSEISTLAMQRNWLGCGSFGTVAQRQAMTSFRSAIAGHLW